MMIMLAPQRVRLRYGRLIKPKTALKVMLDFTEKIPMERSKSALNSIFPAIKVIHSVENVLPFDIK
jgi:hypothetical protein